MGMFTKRYLGNCHLKKGNTNFPFFHFKILIIIQRLKDKLLCFILAITITNHGFLKGSN
jgi:hypothetical protein